MSSGPREQLLSIFQSALSAVNGRTRVCDYFERHSYVGDCYLIAVGKAACAMAQGAQDVLGSRIAEGLIITKQGYAEPLPWPVLETGHPLVDERSLAAGNRLLEYVEEIPATASVVVLLSGGASALVEALPPPISFEQLQEINRWILGSGCDIHVANFIRRRISRIKGGRLAKRLSPRKVLGLVISDVPGDDLRTIGSGPLTADEEMKNPLRLPDIPAFISDALRHMPPAPVLEDSCFQNTRVEIIARLDDAKHAAADSAKKAGFRAVVKTDFVAGDAVEAGTRLAQKLLQSETGVVQVWGGETTVKLPAVAGRGGRNQSLALSAAQSLRGQEKSWLLAVGTDGSDGPTEDAGALVDGGSISRGEEAGFAASQSLAQADAGSFLEASGDLIQTGPTGTNVMDIMLGLRG